MTLTEKLDLISDLLEDNKLAQIAEMINEMHAADISDILIHFNDPEEKLKIFNLVEWETRSDVLIELEPTIQSQIIEQLDTKEVSNLINDMDTDDATDFVSSIEEDRQDQVMALVDEEQKEDMLELMSYDDHTAGGIMSLEYVAVEEHTPVNEIIAAIRIVSEEYGEIYNVWVIDKRNMLIGRLSLKDLVLSKATSLASEIMSSDFHHVDVHIDQEEIARIFEKYDLVEIAVVNEDHQLLGHITVDDIVDVIEEEAFEDMSKFAGTGGSEDIKEASAFKIVRARIPWLVIALFAGLGSAYIISAFQGSINKLVQLAFFIPVVAAMGGNTGIQASTIVIRGMAIGEIDMFDIGHRLFKELRVAFFNGIIVSSIMYGIIFIIWDDNRLALVCGIAMVLSMLTAGILGSLIPFILKKLNLDPALSSGPFITTSNDMIGTFIYFTVANILLF